MLSTRSEPTQTLHKEGEEFYDVDINKGEELNFCYVILSLSVNFTDINNVACCS